MLMTFGKKVGCSYVSQKIMGSNEIWNKFMKIPVFCCCPTSLGLPKFETAGPFGLESDKPGIMLILIQGVW